MQIRYFAWLREQLGLESERFDPPPQVTTMRALMQALRQRGGAYASAFADDAQIRCALDLEFCSLDTELGAAREAAFFPPVSGG